MAIAVITIWAVLATVCAVFFWRKAREWEDIVKAQSEVLDASLKDHEKTLQMWERAEELRSGEAIESRKESVN